MLILQGSTYREVVPPFLEDLLQRLVDVGIQEGSVTTAPVSHCSPPLSQFQHSGTHLAVPIG